MTNTCYRCRLCVNTKDLCRSHIVPEFMYVDLGIYDEKHRLIRFDPGRNSRRTIDQKGIRELLFCEGCENRLSRYEKHAKQVLAKAATIAPNTAQDRLFIKEAEYQRFKLFLISVLWRASISTQPFFSRVDIGHKHEARIRQMLQNEDPGEEHEYGCFIDYIPDTNPLLCRAIIEPSSARVLGHRGVLFFFGAFRWHFFVSSHTQQLRELTEEGAFISPSNGLPIHIDLEGIHAPLTREIFMEIWNMTQLGPRKDQRV